MRLHRTAVIALDCGAQAARCDPSNVARDASECGVSSEKAQVCHYVAAAEDGGNRGSEWRMKRRRREEESSGFLPLLPLELFHCV